MKRNLFWFSLCCLAGLIAGIAAAQTPVQVQADIGVNDTVVNWTVPANTYGPLLTLQVTGLANDATLKVEQVIAYSGGIMTNVVTAAAAVDTRLLYPVTGTNPVWLARGDILRFTPSATNGAAKVVMRVGVGK